MTHSSDEQRHTYDEMLQPPSTVHPHLLVVIDHRGASVYMAELRGSVPQRITPYDPYGYGRQLKYVQDESTGQRKPERATFYTEVARMLQGAEAILLFGHGTGASSAMDHLRNELENHYPDLARRVIKSCIIDQRHLTEAQLLAKARSVYASLGNRST